MARIKMKKKEIRRWAKKTIGELEKLDSNVDGVDEEIEIVKNIYYLAGGKDWKVDPEISALNCSRAGGYVNCDMDADSPYDSWADERR